MTSFVYTQDARRYGPNHPVGSDPMPAADVMHVDTNVREEGIVTLSICPEDHDNGGDDADLGYEIDLTPYSARALGRQLLDAFDEQVVTARTWLNANGWGEAGYMEPGRELELLDEYGQLNRRTE